MLIIAFRVLFDGNNAIVEKCGHFAAILRAEKKGLVIFCGDAEDMSRTASYVGFVP